jgi:hypothetical protein
MSIKQLKILRKRLPDCSGNHVLEDESAVAGMSIQDTLEINDTDDVLIDAPISDNPQQLSSQALFSIFNKAECCTVDGLNEYDDDFSAFTPLGDLVTHEMQQAADRLAKQALGYSNHTVDKITDTVEFVHISIDEKQS